MTKYKLLQDLSYSVPTPGKHKYLTKVIVVPMGTELELEEIPKEKDIMNEIKIYVEKNYINPDAVHIEIYDGDIYFDKAKAFLILSELTKELNGTWKPNWNDSMEKKYHVFYFQQKLITGYDFDIIDNRPCFKTEELAQKAIELAEEYWKQLFNIS